MNDIQFFLEVAEAAARQSTCLRRHYGSVIVDSRRHIISTGYNANCVGMPHCDVTGECPRNSLGIEQYSDYTLCFSVHSEENALIQAGRQANGCILYLYGYDVVGKKEIIPKPCFMCTKLLLNAGIKKVITRHAIYEPFDLFNSYASIIYGKYKPSSFDP